MLLLVGLSTKELRPSMRSEAGQRKVNEREEKTLDATGLQYWSVTTPAMLAIFLHKLHCGAKDSAKFHVDDGLVEQLLTLIVRRATSSHGLEVFGADGSLIVRISAEGLVNLSQYGEGACHSGLRYMAASLSTRASCAVPCAQVFFFCIG